MATFSFAYNPFVILPVSLRAGARDVDEAFQRRLAAKPQDEAALTRARRLLVEPDSRLAAEIAWLIDVGPREAGTLLGAMAGGDQAALLEALANQPPLTRSNVAADACARLKSAAFLRPLAEAHNLLDTFTLTGVINDIHQAIPIDPVAPRQLEAALGALTMLHAAAAMEAIAVQSDPAAALAMVTGVAKPGRFLDEVTARYAARYPAGAEAEAQDYAPVAANEQTAAVANELAPAVGGAFADVHGAGHQGWGEGAAAAAAATTAFMDAQMVFTAPERFDTWGNARRVRRVLYVMGGGLAAMILVYLVAGKGPPDSDASNSVGAHSPSYAAMAVPPPPNLHHKKECITVSGASYCTH